MPIIIESAQGKPVAGLRFNCMLLKAINYFTDGHLSLDSSNVYTDLSYYKRTYVIFIIRPITTWLHDTNM